MKNWTEIYNKHKDSELMKEFVDWWDNRGGEDFSFAWYGDKLRFGEENSILDIWGYLLCFAGTKNIDLQYEYSRDFKEVYCVGVYYGKDKYVEKEDKTYTVEQAMLWCTSKFFGVVK